MIMDSANLPAQGDLNSLYGSWNTQPYLQGMANQDLAGQFRQQTYDANANTVQKGQLENQQSAAMNPMLQQSQALSNTGAGLRNDNQSIANQSSGLDLASKQDAFGDKQSLLHSQLAREMSDEDLTTEGNKYLQLYQQAKLAGNDDDTQKYGGVLDTLVGTASAKASDRIQQRQLAELSTIQKANSSAADRESAERIADTNVAGRANVAGIGASAREAAAAMHMSAGNDIAAEMRKAPQDRDMQKVEYLTRLMQTTTPGFASGVDINSLGGGGGLRANVSAQPPAQQGVTSSGAKYRIVPTGQ